MKKNISSWWLALLLIVVFGCSKENDLTFEKDQAGIQEVVIDTKSQVFEGNIITKMGILTPDPDSVTCWRKIFVRYPYNWTEAQRLAYAEYSQQRVFGIVVRMVNNGCSEHVDTWFVPCSYLQIIAKNRNGNLIVAGSDETENPPPIAPPAWESIQVIVYEHCSEIPLPLEDYP